MLADISSYGIALIAVQASMDPTFTGSGAGPFDCGQTEVLTLPIPLPLTLTLSLNLTLTLTLSLALTLTRHTAAPALSMTRHCTRCARSRERR